MRRHLSVAGVLLVAFAASAAFPSKSKPVARPGTLHSSARNNPTDEAAHALFLRSDVEQARALAAQALRRDHADVRALFVAMEADALAADTRPLLDAALRLCETRRADVRVNDDRVNIAAARVLEQAANTAAFRESVPRIQRLLALTPASPQAPYLRAALLAAAHDGVPGLDPATLARAAGIVTHWRINGPFGKRPNVDWEQPWQPESDPHLAPAYGGQKTEDFYFLDGNVGLPSYLRARDGVFYAESTIDAPHAGQFTLRLETASAGTAQLLLDGHSVLIKDDRFSASADIQSVSVRLSAGSHRLLVKFLDSASPWRVTLLALAPSALAVHRKPATALDAEQRYLRAATKYWQGDAAAVIAALPSPANAAEDLLLGRALLRLTGTTDAPEAAAHFRAALERSPAALAAAYELAAADFSAGRIEDAASGAQRIAALRPDFIPAQELLSEAAERLGWDRVAVHAFEDRIQLHPSCDTLQKAAHLFAKSARYDKARALEDGLRDCAPESLAYYGALSQRGEHALAAAEARRLIVRDPLDRNALTALEKESRLAGNDADATAAAAELASLAPDRSAPEAAADFYLPYRRDGLALARSTAARRFSGGPIVVLLNDKAVRLHPDGSADEYVHRLTRVLTKEGIEQYGEAAPPAGAELLELRTIKLDGRIFEPELHEHKQTISMPSLAPDDVIELEYLLHHATANALEESPEAFHFVFGSFSAPTLYARFVAETPARQALHIYDADNAALRTTQRDGFTARVWEAGDIPQSLAEPSMPGGIEPAESGSVRIEPAYASWTDLRDRYRELAIVAAHAGTQVETAAKRLRVPSEEATARRIVAYVQQAIAVSDADAFASGDLASAEDSLANGEGSRTAAALALAHAAGLDARLLLARRCTAMTKVEKTQRAIGPRVFTQPLVEFAFHHGATTTNITVDVETSGLAFGALPPDIAAGEDAALRVPLSHPTVNATLLALRVPADREANFAAADIQLDAAGDASASLGIRMGSFRGAQMRAALRSRNPAERQQFFEQIALRIFPGATSITGTVRFEDDLDRPLTLELRCRVPRLIDLARLNDSHEDTLDIDQFVPALGLKRMYAAAATRKFALAIDVPLFESATFRLHLPATARVAQRARDTILQSAFGDYSLEFRQPDARTLEMHRDFRIPVERIEPAVYPAFARFASQIEDAERQRLSLARSSGFSAGVAAGK